MSDDMNRQIDHLRADLAAATARADAAERLLLLANNAINTLQDREMGALSEAIQRSAQTGEGADQWPPVYAEWVGLAMGDAFVAAGAVNCTMAAFKGRDGVLYSVVIQKQDGKTPAQLLDEAHAATAAAEALLERARAAVAARDDLLRACYRYRRNNMRVALDLDRSIEQVWLDHPSAALRPTPPPPAPETRDE